MPMRTKVARLKLELDTHASLAAAGLYFIDKPTVADVVYDRDAADGVPVPASPAPELTVTPHLTSNSGTVDVTLRF